MSAMFHGIAAFIHGIVCWLFIASTAGVFGFTGAFVALTFRRQWALSGK